MIPRAERTLELMHRWGYAPTVDALAGALLGGSVLPFNLASALATEGHIRVHNGFVSLAGNEHLVQKSSDRVKTDKLYNGAAWSVAREFAADLARHCTFVECVAVCGSLAAGGYAESDDVDFDIFVKSGRKYQTYLLATLIGLKYSLRHRKRKLSKMHQVLGLPKLVCVNVVWPEDQTRPFVRRDADVAFELLRCQPILGAEYFDRVCRENNWLGSFFPQLYNRNYLDVIGQEESSPNRLLQRLTANPFVVRSLEVICRGIVWSIYHFAQWTRRHDPEAVSRMAFLRKVKWPYEVLQD